MLICINKKSPEYQTLLKRSGIPDSTLEVICRSFMTKYNRLPYLDEITNSNSESSIRNELKLGTYNETSISSILNSTGKLTIKEANIELNNQYRDLEVEIVPLNNDAIIDITHRPTINNFYDLTKEQVISNNPNEYIIFTRALLKLASLYGITFNTVTDAELNSDEWRNIISDPSSINAFVYNGQIYINLDRASLDAPLHEMMHIFVGSIRFSDPNLYFSLISLAEKFPNYKELTKLFSGRTRNDINEEIFISEMSRYLMGLKSVLHNLDNKAKYEISYNIKRLLDTILMGLDSVKTISNDRLFLLSLMLIALEVNSTVMTNNFHGTINVENSELHRKLNNTKSDLYKLGILLEYCD